jgi:hypothetical protein
MIRTLLLSSLFSLAASVAFAGEPNTLAAEEKADGWKLLFDGQSSRGWVGIGKSTFPAEGWSVVNGALVHAHNAGGGDIVTAETYENFELVWEWRLAKAGNSGVKYNLVDPKKAVGFEYQLLDDVEHPDAKKLTRQTAGLYDLIEPAADKQLNPPGEWNTSRLVVQGLRVEHWLNGAKTLEFTIGSAALQEAVAKSKYAKIPGFGVKAASPILLQDHKDEVAFRSIKLRVLDAK